MPINYKVRHMEFDSARDMSEFDWEKQLREDDERLVSSMREIPSVIDLPGEDDLLRKRLQLKLSKVRKQVEWEFIGGDDFMDYDDVMFPDNWRELPEAKVYDGIELLMRHWCAIYSSKLSPKHNALGIQALCVYGRMMGFAIDLVDVAGDKPVPLKVALCKRLAKDLDRMFGIIDSMKIDSGSIKKHQSRLTETRAKVLRLLFQLRNENNSD
ncbi:MAG: hypothetical protein KAG97_08570 [Victivallales bacterium]|nr:hypothetical protein [Victivallales bacterium]